MRGSTACCSNMLLSGWRVNGGACVNGHGLCAKWNVCGCTNSCEQIITFGSGPVRYFSVWKLETSST